MSVLLYVGALVGVLAVAAVPVYLATKAEVYDIPPLARADPLLNGPIVGNRVSARVPLARLRRETILDPAIVEALNAKAEKAAPARHAVRRSTPRPDRTPVAELRDEPKRQGFFLFNLFGG